MSLHAFFFFCLHFKFTFTLHIFISKVTCYFCYRLTILLPFYPFITLNCVQTPPLHRDVSGTASGRNVRRYVVTQFRAHRQGGKKRRIPGCNLPRDSLSDSSNIFLSYTGLLIFCPCVCDNSVKCNLEIAKKSIKVW